MHLSTVLATALLASATAASPLYTRTHLTTAGSLRPRELITRDLEVRDLNEHLNGLQRRQLLDGLLVGDENSAESETGSSTSSTSLGSAASSSESASNDTSTSSSSSCEFLGGCSSGSAAACPVDASNDNVENSTTSSSICGSSTSTSSSSFLSVGRLVRRIGAALSFSRE